MCARGYGLNIIAGPKGSWRSLVVNRIIAAAARRRHAVSVTDGTEEPILGVVQVHVTSPAMGDREGGAWQKALRSAMRIDPDVILVSGLDDPAVARFITQAATTGHQVWTTVEANSAFAVVEMLERFGLLHQLLRDPIALSGIVCQRVVRTLCPHCKAPLLDRLNQYRDAEVGRWAKVVELSRIRVRGDGCPRCDVSGYAGRAVVSEALPVDRTLSDYLASGIKAGALGYWRRALGAVTMLEDAIAKVRSGAVDPADAETVFGPLGGGSPRAEHPLSPECAPLASAGPGTSSIA